MRRKHSSHFDYWFDVILGGLVVFGLLYLLGHLFITRYESKIVDYFYFISCFFVVAYYQWNDDNFNAVDTNLSKAENFKLVTNALDNLGWSCKVYKNDIRLVHNKYILKFLSVSIIPEQGKIYYNFRYHSTMSGRTPFFFGISTFLKYRFDNSLNKELNKLSASKKT